VYIETDEFLKKIKCTGNDEKAYEMYYRRPKWYKIMYDADDSVAGQILLGYSIIDDSVKDKIEMYEIRPSGTDMTFLMYCLGLRDIDINGEIPSKARMKFNLCGVCKDESNYKTGLK
jgi:hypothetical protein